MKIWYVNHELKISKYRCLENIDFSRFTNCFPFSSMPNHQQIIISFDTISFRKGKKSSTKISMHGRRILLMVCSSITRLFPNKIFASFYLLSHAQGKKRERNISHEFWKVLSQPRFSSSVLGIPSRLKYEKDDLKHERTVQWGVEYEKDRCNG